MRYGEILAVFAARHPEASATLVSDARGVVVSLSGSLDMAVSEDFGVLLSSSLELAEVGRPFVVDLSGVAYISSTGVGTLVTALAHARRRSIPLSLRNMSPAVRDVFELLGFLPFFPDEAANGRG